MQYSAYPCSAVGVGLRNYFELEYDKMNILMQELEPPIRNESHTLRGLGIQLAVMKNPSLIVFVCW